MTWDVWDEPKGSGCLLQNCPWDTGPHCWRGRGRAKPPGKDPYPFDFVDTHLIQNIPQVDQFWGVVICGKPISEIGSTVGTLGAGLKIGKSLGSRLKSDPSNWGQKVCLHANQV